MKVFRFMSKKEFEAFQKGRVLTNYTIHKAGTNSIGFCFLDEEEYKPEEAYHFLIGAIFPEVCVVFEVDETNLRKTWGKYAKHVKETGNTEEDIMNIFKNWDNYFIANEYCTQCYLNKDFKLIKYAIPDYFNREEWDWTHA